MTTSTKQITANQRNAQKSTGPKSDDGKAIAAQNATRHGILSTRLFLQDDNGRALGHAATLAAHAARARELRTGRRRRSPPPPG